MPPSTAKVGTSRHLADVRRWKAVLEVEGLYSTIDEDIVMC
jgi:hypothetical protein